MLAGALGFVVPFMRARAKAAAKTLELALRPALLCADGKAQCIDMLLHTPIISDRAPLSTQLSPLVHFLRELVRERFA